MLTNAQKADVRRYAGYPLLADLTADSNSDAAQGWVAPGVLHTLAHRLDHLRAEEEATLIASYLTPLATLEAAIPGAGANLDTDQAAVWHRNRSEVRDRAALFDDWRRRMCGFLGIAPGPALSAGNAAMLVRA